SDLTSQCISISGRNITTEPRDSFSLSRQTTGCSNCRRLCTSPMGLCCGAQTNLTGLIPLDGGRQRCGSCVSLAERLCERFILGQHGSALSAWQGCPAVVLRSGHIAHSVLLPNPNISAYTGAKSP